MTLIDNNTDALVNNTLLEDISTDYEYVPLAKERHIRLIQIRPSTDDGNPIQLVVRHFDSDPDHDMNFVALSYVWKTRLPTYRVHIKGQDNSGWLPIRQGLYDFLRTQRSLNEPSLWS